MSKVRDSNIELLRIVATLFIVILHCNGWLLTFGNNPIYWNYGGINIILPRLIIQNITVIGVDLFVLISGFYGIKPKLKSIVNLYTCLLFFYCGSYLIDCIRPGVSFNIKNLLQQILVFSRENWFINCYLFLMLLSPALNSFMNNVNKKYASIYLLIFLTCSFYFGCLWDHKYFMFNQGYSVIMMVLVYLVGRYMKLHLIEYIDKIKYSHLLFGYFISLGLLIINYIISKYTITSLHGYHSPVMILSAVCFFALFYRMPKFYNKIINWISVSCLSVYIFHTCSPFLGLLSRADRYLFYNYNFVIYAILMLVIIICVFAFAICLDKIRLFLVKPIIKKITV